MGSGIRIFFILNIISMTLMIIIITSNVLKFADDAKVFRKVKNDADKQH